MDETSAGDHYVSSCVVAALGVALQLPIFNRGLVAIDEGQIASFAERILRGEIIYRDFYTGLFPGIYYFCAGLFAVFGHDLLWTRIAQLAVNVGVAVLIHRLALRVSTPFWAFLWAVAYFVLVVASFPTLTMLTYSPLSIAFALAALLVGLRLMNSPSRSGLLLLGTLLAGCGLMKQNYGALAVVAIGIILCASRTVLRDAELSVGRAILHVVVAGVISSAAFLAPLFLSGAAPKFFRYTVGTVLHSQLTAFHQPLPPLLESAPSQEGNFLFFYLPNVLIGYALRGEAVLGVPMSEYVRWALIRVGYGGALLVLALGWALLLAEFRRLEPRKRLTRAAVMVFAQLMYFGLFPSAIWSHLATVAAPILVVGAMVSAAVTKGSRPLALFTGRLVTCFGCGVFVLACASAVQITRDVRRWNPTPTGLSRATLHIPENDAQRLQAAVGFLRSCAKSDDPIFVAPDLPVLYFLSDRRNATPYEMLIPGDIDEALLIALLTTSDTSCVVYNPRMYAHFAPLSEDFPNFVHWLGDSFSSRTEIQPGDPPWLALVRNK